MPINRELRKKMALAFGAKAFQKNKYDNQEIVLKIAKLRYERAKLLGYETHAHFCSRRTHGGKSWESKINFWVTCSLKQNLQPNVNSNNWRNSPKNLTASTSLKNGMAPIIPKNSNSSCSILMMRNSNRISSWKKVFGWCFHRSSKTLRIDVHRNFRHRQIPWRSDDLMNDQRWKWEFSRDFSTPISSQEKGNATAPGWLRSNRNILRAASTNVRTFQTFAISPSQPKRNLRY